MVSKKSPVKWPNVPDVYNWLVLDERGNWLIKKEKIFHKGLIDFINAQYTVDDKGRWFFQNGPQRVFVTLEYTPYVLTLASHDSVIYFKTQTNENVETIDKLWIDNKGRLLVSWESNIGLVCDRDLPLLADKLSHNNKSIDQMDPNELASIRHQIPSGGETSLTLMMNRKTYNIFFIDEVEVSKLFSFNLKPNPPDGDPDC